MAIDLRTTGYGAAAAALAAEVSRVKAGDPLAPVAVVVPTNYAGVSARRRLAAASAPDGRAGIAGLTTLTLYRLGELLGAQRLIAAGRRPVSTAVLAATVRQVLADEAGVFAPVRDHPATERTLIAAHRQLSDLPDRAISALAAQSRRAADVVRVHRAVRSRLAGRWYEEQDLLASAADAVSDTAQPVELGAVILHLPQHVSGPASRLVLALGTRLPVTVIAGLTGVADADRTVTRSLERLGLGIADTPAPQPAAAHRIVAVSDPDEEVRSVVRTVIGARRQGTRLERMAIVHAAPEPYGRLLHEHLAAAGLPYNGTAPRRLAETLLGRTLLGLLALPDHDWRRTDVVDLLAASPIRGADSRLVPSAAWERISRRAGVVRGAEGWASRLANFADDRRADAADEARREGREWLERRARREADQAEALAGFVARLVADTSPTAAPRSWRGLCRWIRKLGRSYLGGDHARSQWPELEQRAAERVDQVLDRLEVLDDVEERPSLTVFRRTLELELDAALGRIGRFGEGVLVAPPWAAVGIDVDRVFVVGMAEGMFPGRVHDDSLLPDRERLVTGGELPLASQRVHDDHRHYLAAVAAASDEAVLLFPRGDLRQSIERVPSRWLLDTVEGKVGRRVYADDLAGLDHPWLTDEPSFVAALTRVEFPASAHEYDLRSVFDHDRRALPLAGHELTGRDPVFRRGLELVGARRSSRFTRFDGNLASLAVPSPTDPDQIVSPTRLETWAACPHRYLFRHVLRVEPVELPDAQLRISPLDRGNIVHHTLDAFVRSVLARPESERPGPGDPWTAADHQLLRDLALDEFRRYEQRGLVGKALFWRRDRRQILRDLHLFLLHDDQRRRELRTRPVESELGFGVPGAERPPVTVTLADGRSLRFRGSADRVDRADDGSLVVIDYKTGSPTAYRKLGSDDPDSRGTRLQLPVYAAAAAEAFGPTVADVLAGYWFVTEHRRFVWVGYPVDAGVQQRFSDVLAVIADGIERGVFPARPAEETSWRGWVDCEYCDPDGLGTRDRRLEWERKRHAPEVAAYLELAEPEVAAAGSGHG